MEEDSIITQIHSIPGYPTINVWMSGRLTIPEDDGNQIPLTDKSAIIAILNKMRNPEISKFKTLEDIQRYIKNTGDEIMGNALPDDGIEQWFDR